MCGLAGFLLAEPRFGSAELEARLWRMIAPLRHRGPDDEGVWTDGRAGLAHARLSIIDPSPAGRQPMPSADRQAWVSYNGEIYNHRELRRELAGLGHSFHSRSDTETIVEGWRAWGLDLLPRLRGMFAIAIWDRQARRLILARDRVGKKPLYYARTATALLFASEIKGLLAWPDVPREPNLTAIDLYLSLGYVPSPHTAFAGVEKLPPAHYLTVDILPDGALGKPQITRYWRLPTAVGTARKPRLAEIREELVQHLEEAVRLRLIADVPLGAFLSGGIDSASVVAMMARVGGGKVKTFSIGFAAREYDETGYARMVADRYGTDHHEFTVEPDAVAVLPRLVWHYGEPFADSSAIPTYYVAQQARTAVTVALTGDGGDECFFGYRRYRAMRHLSRLDRWPDWARRGLGRALSSAPQELARRWRLQRIGDALGAPRTRPERRYAPTIVYFAAEQKSHLYGEAMGDTAMTAEGELLAPHFAAAESLAAGANRADIHTYLPDDLMVKVDVATMAHGLEARCPFLDHVLLEWAARLPEAVKFRRGVLKSLLKSAMAPYLPAPILHRPKRGFALPVDHWLRGELKNLAYDTLLSRRAAERGLLRPDRVQTLLDEHCSRAADHHTRLWALLMLELWFETWIDAPASAAVLQPAA
jgi:asparagine synthase (glutamine-hydrolysing)